MGEIIEVTIFMWIVALVAFAPLGYFIYLFMVSDGESFGKSNPDDHAVEHTSYYKLIDVAMRTLMGSTGKDKTKSAFSPSRPVVSAPAVPRPRPKPRIEEPPKKSKGKKKSGKKKKSK